VAILRQADAVVGDLQLQPVAYGEPDVAGACFRVVDDVGQGLLRNAVGGHLNGGGKRWQVFRGLHGDVEAVMTVVGRLLADGRDQAQFVEGGRPEVVDQAPYVGDCGLRLGLELGQERVGGLRLL
jgi:hypothetical protein